MLIENYGQVFLTCACAFWRTSSRLTMVGVGCMNARYRLTTGTHDGTQQLDAIFRKTHFTSAESCRIVRLGLSGLRVTWTNPVRWSASFLYTLYVIRQTPCPS